eukprot:TRINITY_DN65064_c1_g1_i1.p3 TRINITY_DN65064_c1_g1~~TRINITY_DN65064_c1_g1_i1.p3  ORF type:complete len:136 (-),score=23.59 TRINITY_DN65064_c1_g1_i1:331-738(-)
MPQHKLGWTYNPVPQTKVDWEMRKVGFGIKTKMPVTMTRKEKWVAYMSYMDLKDVNAWNIIRGKLAAAAAAGLAAAGGIGAVTANPAAAFAAFVKAFKTSLMSLTAGSVASSIIATFVSSIKLSVDSETEGWSKV